MPILPDHGGSVNVCTLALLDGVGHLGERDDDSRRHRSAVRRADQRDRDRLAYCSLPFALGALRRHHRETSGEAGEQFAKRPAMARAPLTRE